MIIGISAKERAAPVARTARKLSSPGRVMTPSLTFPAVE